MEINRKHVGAGIVAVASVLLARAGCNDEVKTPQAETHDLSNSTSKVKQTVSRVFEPDTDADEEEYTVDVELDEDGNVAKGFNQVSAIRDCVESTGKYVCFDQSPFDYTWNWSSTCYKENPEEGQIPVMISNGPMSFLDYLWAREFIGVDAGNNVNLAFAGLDKNDPTSYQAALNSACKSVIDGMEMQLSESDFDDMKGGNFEYWETQVALYPDLSDGTNAIFESLNEMGIETKDLGGNVFSFDIGHGGTGRIYGEITSLSQNEDEDDELGVIYKVMFDDHVSTRAEDVDEAIDNAIILRDYNLSGLQE